MKNRSYLLNFALIAATAVSTYFVAPLITGHATAQQGAAPATAQNPSEYQLSATLYMQKAGEYRALAYQAYNIATERLDKDYAKNKKRLKKHPRAVVVDIDETILDNSPANAKLIKDSQGYSDAEWNAWIKKKEAKPIAGAVTFLNHATDLGYKVFYISNRKENAPDLVNKTKENLIAAGFKNVTDDSIMLRTAEKSKKNRRDKVTGMGYEIIILMGDNLDDFSEIFEADNTKTIAGRFDVVESNKQNFGYKFIALPNAYYGTWADMITSEYHGVKEGALELPSAP
jgi:5'-nucleotidase (lipoprotein e(P4) family)